MTDLTTRLRDADPVTQESGPSFDDLAAMRRTIVAAAEAAPAGAAWRQPLALAAAAALLFVIGTLTFHGVAPAVREPKVPPAPSAAGRPTQVHFSTPGGTRIIWTLDPAFQLKGATR
jgi:hypothetical protein